MSADALDRQHRAREAGRLLNEPLLAEAMEAVRMKALVELGTVDLGDIKKVMELRALANGTQELLDALTAILLEGGGMDGGIAPETVDAQG